MDLDIHKLTLLPFLMDSNVFIRVKLLSKKCVVSFFPQQIHTKSKTFSVAKNTIDQKTSKISGI